MPIEKEGSAALALRLVHETFLHIVLNRPSGREIGHFVAHLLLDEQRDQPPRMKDEPVQIELVFL